MKVTTTMKARMIDMRAKGVSISTIARLLGCSRHSVRFHTEEKEMEKRRADAKARNARLKAERGPGVFNPYKQQASAITFELNRLFASRTAWEGTKERAMARLGRINAQIAELTAERQAFRDKYEALKGVTQP